MVYSYWYWYMVDTMDCGLWTVDGGTGGRRVVSASIDFRLRVRLLGLQG